MSANIERAPLGRSKPRRRALLFFHGQHGFHVCDVVEMTSTGAIIFTQYLTALPLQFELSFDDFRNVQKCNLIWRDGDIIAVAFQS